MIQIARTHLLYLRKQEHHDDPDTEAVVASKTCPFESIPKYGLPLPKTTGTMSIAT